MSPRGRSVAVRDLSVRLGAFHLEAVTFDAAPGEYLMILGPTGAGKTVLLECIAGLQDPDSGRILIGDSDVTHAPPERRRIGFVPQDCALFPHLSVAENIAFGLRIRGGEPEGEVRRKVWEMAERLGITHLLGRRPTTLSGGERQRAALARALVVEPSVLLLDEPLSALDPATRAEIAGDLKRVHRATGVTCLHITHDFDEAFELADKVVLFADGRVIQIGTPEQLLHRPNSLFAARFVRMENILPCRVETDGSGERVVRLGPDFRLRSAASALPDGSAWAVIRGQDLELASVNGAISGTVGADAGESDLIRGVITEIYRRRNGWIVVVSTGNDRGPALRVHVAGTRRSGNGLTPGARVVVRVHPEAVHLIPRSPDEGAALRVHGPAGRDGSGRQREAGRRRKQEQDVMAGDDRTGEDMP